MDSWKHTSDVMPDVMAGIKARMNAQRALQNSAILIETARATDNDHLHRQAAEQLVQFDIEAERQQLGE